MIGMIETEKERLEHNLKEEKHKRVEIVEKHYFLKERKEKKLSS
jgi:hypothetical protein